ncbi:MAG: hypothetical protein M1826_002866 [Phylliscum demangeonii]|nr:MAG: hypothetical protein M1826_002866 [Phylliscum demangeonii]
MPPLPPPAYNPRKGTGAHPPPLPRSRIPLAITLLAIFSLSTYGSYLYRSYTGAVARSASLAATSSLTDTGDAPDLSDRYDGAAATYDRDIGRAEWVMGMGRLRRRLVRKACGDVLEVAAGTGRNLKYYRWRRRGEGEGKEMEMEGCTRLTLLDKSRPMLERARAVEGEMRKLGRRSHRAGTVPDPTPTAFLLHDATQPLASPPRPRHGYDTVVQTMGLCSTPDPVRLLRALGALAHPEHGRILLLEHGRSHYGWLNAVLDRLAALHADRHGCWWNRDVAAIVRASGLEVVALRRFHWGTTWWVELRPCRSGEGRDESGGGGGGGGGDTKGERQSK